MASDIFEFRDYGPYLTEIFGDKSRRKGLKSKAAKFIGCHSTLISQILSGKILLNLEQAEKLNRFIGHNEEESHFFLLLIQKARSGTKQLEQYFENQLEQIRKARLNLKKRVGKTETISEEDELRYYSNWHNAAVHVALSIPQLIHAEEISEALGIPLAQVRSILTFLLKTGMAIPHPKDSRGFAIGPKHIHLGADSTHIRNHHVNWRVKSIQSLDQDASSERGLHYSSAVTLSKSDVEKIKEMLITNLKSMNTVIAASKEEAIYGLNFDFFNLAVK
jgi:uncharacterized protein (TIGR02147 family)